ncbi:hypothetical protein AQUCO_00200114v1 [Aquilegia coerulea]|nr:hypothetical protein AQUCO_00200114v1 [Aquilegia coerulea]
MPPPLSDISMYVLLFSPFRVFISKVMCTTDPQHGRYLTVFAMFLGNMSTKEVDEQMTNSRKDLLILLSGSQTMSNQLSATFHQLALRWHLPFIGNSTSLQEIFIIQAWK